MSKRVIIIAAVVVAVAIGLFFWLQPATRFVYALSPVAPDEAVLLTRRNEDDATYFWAQLVQSDGTVRWSTEVSPFDTVEALGFTGVAATAERVFLLGEVDDALEVRALSRADGEPLWATSIGHGESSYIGAPSLLTDGARVFALHDTPGMRETLTTLDVDGRVLWTHTVGSDGRLFVGSRIIAQKGGHTVELDRATGQVVRTLTMDRRIHDTPLGLVGTRLGKLMLLGSDGVERTIALPGYVALDVGGVIDNDLVVDFNDASDVRTLARVDPTSGTLVWRLALPSSMIGTLNTPDHALPRFVAIMVDRVALSIDLTTGAIVARRPIEYYAVAFTTATRAYVFQGVPDLMIAVDPTTGAFGPSWQIKKVWASDMMPEDYRLGRLWVAGDGWAKPDGVSFGVFDLGTATIVSERGNVRFVPLSP